MRVVNIPLERSYNGVFFFIILLLYPWVSYHQQNNNQREIKTRDCSVRRGEITFKELAVLCTPSNPDCYRAVRQTEKTNIILLLTWRLKVLWCLVILFRDSTLPF